MEALTAQLKEGYRKMVGMLQIMIWLLCVYLVFKGVEIFQIAFMSAREGAQRKTGITLGVIMIIAAILASLIFFVMEEQVAQSISDSQKGLQNLPGLNR